MEKEVDYLLDSLLNVDGVICVAIIDNLKKKIIFNREVDDRFNILTDMMSDIIRANIKYSRLTSKKDELDDILIAYRNEIHLLKPLCYTEKFFLYIGIAKGSNIALTRLHLDEKIKIHLNQ